MLSGVVPLPPVPPPARRPPPPLPSQRRARPPLPPVVTTGPATSAGPPSVSTVVHRAQPAPPYRARRHRPTEHPGREWAKRVAVFGVLYPVVGLALLTFVLMVAAGEIPAGR